MANSARFWISHLQMEPHPEGGYFAVVHRSADWLPKDHFKDVDHIPRNLSSHIYYLLESGQKSAVHRLAFAEIWHFYAGDPLELFYLTEADKLEKLILANAGNDPNPVVNVPGKAWQWAKPMEGDQGYSLVGCTMTPAFHEEDWEMGKREDLLEKYPHLGDFWEKYCGE